MSSFRDLVKKVNEEKKSAAPASTQEQPTTRNESSESFRKLVRGVNNGTIRVASTLNDSQVDDWAAGVSSVLDRASSYLSSDGYRKEDTSLERKLEEYLSQSQDVAQYLRANRFSIENYDDVMQSYHDTVSSLRSGQKGVSSTGKFFSQWEDEKSYNDYMAKIKDYEEKKNFDIAAGEKEISGLETMLQTYKNLTRFTTDEQGALRAEQIRQLRRSQHLHGPSC